MKHCPKCNKKHNNNGKFCSRSCSNYRERSLETKLKISNAVKNSQKFKDAIKNSFIERIDKVCPVCKTMFSIPFTNKKIYCSRECYLKDSNHLYRKISSGGYREGSGRSKSGYYKNIYCGSTYELCWVIYNLDHNIKFTRFPGYIKDDELKYYPDFLLEDTTTIIEIKGFENVEQVNKKTQLAEKHGYIVKVLYKEDLKYCFEYVKEKYKTVDYKTLYDNYKPKYEYTCSHCDTVFFRERESKSANKFCSRSCVGKAHKGRNKLGINQYTKSR